MVQNIAQRLEEIGFVFNPYDACVANRTVEGSQHTIKFHVDDMWSSHKHRSVNIKFKKWLNEKYGKYGEVTADHSKYFNYLGVNYDLREKGVLKVDMIDYMKDMVNECPMDLTNASEKHSTTPKLFAESTGKKLDAERHATFRAVVGKGIFAWKRARPDIHTAIAGLSDKQ